MDPVLCYKCRFDDRKRPCMAGGAERDFGLMADEYVFRWTARIAGNDTDDPGDWINDCLFELEYNDPSGCLFFIVVTLDRVASLEVLAVLAAGPMENVLDNFGQDVIEPVERLARRSTKFRLLLSGIWGGSRIEPDVWMRVKAAVAPGPLFSDDPRNPGDPAKASTVTEEEGLRILATSVIADIGGIEQAKALTGLVPG